MPPPDPSRVSLGSEVQNHCPFLFLSSVEKLSAAFSGRESRYFIFASVLSAYPFYNHGFDIFTNLNLNE